MPNIKTVKKKLRPEKMSRGKNGMDRQIGGAEGNRTPDLLIANEALSQLSYNPNLFIRDEKL